MTNLARFFHENKSLNSIPHVPTIVVTYNKSKSSNCNFSTGINTFRYW